MAEVRPLTIANWTPDVVAAIFLGTLFGINAVLFLIFLELTMPVWPVRIFRLLIPLLLCGLVAFVAYAVVQIATF